VELLIEDVAELLIDEEAELLAGEDAELTAVEDDELLVENDTELLIEDDTKLLLKDEVEMAVELAVKDKLDELLMLKSILKSVRPLGPPQISVELALQGMLQRLSVTSRELAFNTLPQ
jgi:hypothetical protein